MGRLLTLRRLFGKVDLASLRRIEASYSGLGPRHYPVKAVFLALVLMHLLAVPSETMLTGYLSVHRDLAEACGFNRPKCRRGTPSQSALNRFKHRVGVEGFQSILEELVRCLLKAGVAKGRWVVVDSSAVEAYFHRDPDARWGYRDVDKPFFGYKLHILIDVKTELPIAFRITKGNIHDSQEYLNLLDQVEDPAAPEHAYGDAAYDSEALRQASMSLYDVELHTPRNPRRRGGKAKSSKTLKRMKSAVERVFSRLKLLRFKDLKAEGFASAAIHMLLALITMLAVALSAKRNGLTRKIRCIRSLAA